ncbi:DNA replication/repair protein RecF [Streptococcus panodentis]|uniref:DNA replication and repair protein RecF n=1 Tax=Streptococcus panodentis TaxID=1581472 RepID=A0ABS5AUJ3_9STRE|nr:MULTISPECIES: DNA replication/repair protein RecF [Streptococcus]KXT84933.1 DNA recombination and repair protein RecF [Streptococcus sp. DD11]MBP2620242.1 DNA replication/repair protein RecF [Streptococcus panodentis]
MRLQSLKIKQFRNYQTAEIDCNPGLNVFLGQNAQGKTNVLEAIYFLALTRSHRTRSDKDLIHFNQDGLHVSGILEKRTSKVPLDIELTTKGRITKINHLKQAKLSDYIGTMNVVLFAPEDLQLIKGSPALRRKFIDIELGQIKPIYLADLSNYNHVLKQRNAYLKANEKVDETFLSVLDEQLIDYGCRVMQHRHEFLEKLEKFAQEQHWEISQHLEKLTINYLSSIPLQEVDSLETAFRLSLEKSRKRDLFKKNTGVGPHRDDIAFFINEMDANFGSQGQHRSVVLSLKLAEIKLIESITQETPILLLDDVMSELDNNRQLKLLETISQNIQTFITTTSLEHLKNLPEDIKIFKIKQGVIHSSQPEKDD